MNPFSLDNKHIVISGASSGIGQKCAISCAAMGAKISLLGRNIERLEQTLSSLQGPNHFVYRVDLTNEENVKNTVSEIVAKNGRVDGLINAAGISTTLPMRSVTKKVLEDLFENNVYSAYMLTKEISKVGHFSQKGGSIIFISSVMGSYGEVGKSSYAMTKGALQAGTKSLACELAAKKIRVNTISPGVIITPINENLPHIKNEIKRGLLESKHLLGFGKTSDVANSCIFLLSDAASWITGINLFVDGGYSVI